MDQLNQIKPINLTEKIIINKETVQACINEGESMHKQESINLTIDEGTEQKLYNVKEHLNLPDDPTTLKMAISLYSKLIDAKKAGREIRIHDKDGKQYRLEFASGP